VTPAADRLAMTELAAAALGNSSARVRVSRMEVDRAGPSYTIDTVRQLRAEYGPEASLCWLMGADQLLRLHTWHGWLELFEHVHLCTATRPRFALAALEGPVLAALAERRADTHLIQCTPSGRMWIDQTLAVDLSSTHLRQRKARPCGGAQVHVLEQFQPPICASGWQPASRQMTNCRPAWHTTLPATGCTATPRPGHDQGCIDPGAHPQPI
jgi:nicotinate (nicotinamide) nucleotide adenylyltransferase